VTDDGSLNLFQQQEANRRRTSWLVVGFVLFFAWLGFGGDYIYYLATLHAPPGAAHHTFPWVGILLTIAGVGIAWYGYTTGPEKVLWSTDAREIVAPATDQEKLLVNVVEEMAIAAGVPRPRIWIVPDADPNAFATGTDPQHAHVAVTQGLLDLMSRDELQGVIAHELGHVKNFDIRLMTTLAALVGVVLLMRDGAGRVFFGGSGGRSRGKSDLGPLVAVLLVVWVISWILAPLITQFLAMAVSRKREYLADAMSAQFTRNPVALASALQKIETSDAPATHLKSGAAHLCICDPLERRLNDHPGGLGDVLASHPPIEMRIIRLKGMGYAQAKQTT
jgi:heat shock protein HtpX